MAESPTSPDVIGIAKRLEHSHFDSADAGFMTGLISVIVQGCASVARLDELWSIPSALADITMTMALQLRRASGNFTNFVLVRAVRLTIETNALTVDDAKELRLSGNSVRVTALSSLCFVAPERSRKRQKASFPT
ncbi:hypothetical protein V8E53_015340 [Lactarius tabidus]